MNLFCVIIIPFLVGGLFTTSSETIKMMHNFTDFRKDRSEILRQVYSCGPQGLLFLLSRNLELAVPKIIADRQWPHSFVIKGINELSRQIADIFDINVVRSTFLYSRLPQLDQARTLLVFCYHYIVPLLRLPICTAK